MGVLQVHLSGGEPASRRDLVDLVAHCAGAGLYTNLITSGIGLTPKLVAGLSEAGLDHVQLSIQDSDDDSADCIAGYRGAAAKKREVAAEVVRAGLPLTINAVIHRANTCIAPAPCWNVRSPGERGASRSPTRNITAGRGATAPP